MKTDQWRLLLAFVLSFVVIYAFQALLPQPEPLPPPEAQATEQVVPNQTVNNPPPAPAAGQAEVAPEPAPGAGAPEALVGESVERDIVVETDKVEAVFSNRGGVLTSWKLKGFHDANGGLHDLVPQGIPQDLARPFTLRFADDADLSARLSSALFQAQTGPSSSVRFAYEDASGVSVTKLFSLSPDTYVLNVDIDASADGRALVPAVEWGPALGPLTGRIVSRYSQPSRGILYTSDGLERLDAGDVEDAPLQSGAFEFGGVDDQYFLSALVQPGASRFEFVPLSVTAAAGIGEPVNFISYDVQLEAGSGAQRFFVGPKNIDELRAVDATLVRAINFGRFLGWLVAPLLTSLKWLNGYIGNYGWSIITLTILINGIMFPLRHKSVVSMRKMQEIQPEIKAIQDRYAKLKATDPAKQKMNTEMMGLYRDRGVNPASGCIPMLLTMPVLFAFYRLLSIAVELRGAPFMGWITDLSAPDPLYITPIVMGVTMVVQQRMTPNTLEPMQQKMMMFMPVVFTFLFLQAPSGLVLYWLVSNVWAIGQQKVTNRIIGPPKIKHVRPPAERRLKKAGAGKSVAAEKSD